MHFFKSVLARLKYFAPFLVTENVWEQNKIVEQYFPKTDLFYPEQLFLNKLRDDSLAEMRMLDLGVGAGRTTEHFAPLVKEYVGIDASKNMIKACNKKFQTTKNVVFMVGDARDLQLFDCESFDFVLFSFNGLDCMDHEDRIKTLAEIHRVLKSGGFFCFSSHNLNWVWKYWALKKSSFSSIIRFIRQVFLLRLYNRKNWGKLRDRNKSFGHMVVIDGAHDFSVKNYHITPTEQKTQLINAHFQDIEVYTLSGKTPDLSKIESDDDAWLYYFCKK